MKTREEIESWHADKRQAIWAKYQQQHKALTDAEDDEIGALNDQYADALKAVAYYDPMARLIAAAKKWHDNHCLSFGACSNSVCVDLRDAIDYAEQRRAQG